jgi:hypothetical protein
MFSAPGHPRSNEVLDAYHAAGRLVKAERAVPSTASVLTASESPLYNNSETQRTVSTTLSE